MSKEYCERLESFMNAMIQAKVMMKQGIIDEKDYLKIESKIAEKYCIKTNSLYRSNDLIKRN